MDGLKYQYLEYNFEEMAHAPCSPSSTGLGSPRDPAFCLHDTGNLDHYQIEYLCQAFNTVFPERDPLCIDKEFPMRELISFLAPYLALATIEDLHEIYLEIEAHSKDPETFWNNPIALDVTCSALKLTAETPHKLKQLLLAKCKEYFTRAIEHFHRGACPAHLSLTRLPEAHSIAIISPVKFGLGHHRPACALSDLYIKHHYCVLHIRYHSEITQDNKLTEIARKVNAFNPCLIISMIDSPIFLSQIFTFSRTALFAVPNTDFFNKHLPINPPKRVVAEKRIVHAEPRLLYEPDYKPSHPSSRALGFPLSYDIRQTRTPEELDLVKLEHQIPEGSKVAFFTSSQHCDASWWILDKVFKSLSNPSTSPLCKFKLHLIINYRSVHGDKDMSNLLQKKIEKHEKRENFFMSRDITISFTPLLLNMGAYYQLADVIYAKPGGSTTAELLYMMRNFHKPVIIPSKIASDSLRCEYHNAEFLERFSAVTTMNRDDDHLISVIEKVLESNTEMDPLPEDPWEESYLELAREAATVTHASDVLSGPKITCGAGGPDSD